MSDALGPWPGAVDSSTTSSTTTSATTTTATTTATALIPWPADAPELYDQITLAGVVLPGIVRFTGEVGRKLDVKNAKGSDGATITDDGSDPETLELSLVLWTANHWATYQSIVPTINPNNIKGKMKPVDVSHPVLALHGILRIYIEKLSLPVPGKVPQTLEVRIKARGWRPEPKAQSTSKTSTPSSSDTSQKQWGDSVMAERWGGGGTPEQTAERWGADAGKPGAW